MFFSNAVLWRKKTKTSKPGASNHQTPSRRAAKSCAGLQTAAETSQQDSSINNWFLRWKKRNGTNKILLFCILSLNFRKLPERQIKRGPTSVCAVPHQRTSVRHAHRNRICCILLFLFVQLCNIMFSARRCKRLNWIKVVRRRKAKKKKKAQISQNLKFTQTS